jgi:serine/threonine-protein kinase
MRVRDKKPERLPPPHDPTLLETDGAVDSGPGPSELRLKNRELKERGQLGAGGTGTVHRAFDTRMLREVAKKTLATKLAGDMRAFVHFVQEAELTAQLEHPNIVPVHELDVDSQGRAYFSMRMVRGRTLTKLVRSARETLVTPETLHRHLAIFLSICDAVVYAHDKGVIHADIKPDNVMVGDFGEVYLMDWGNAHLDPRVRGAAMVSHLPLRRVRSVGGTPGFASPEQAQGRTELIGPWTDVFGLGTVLYFLVTGQPPFAGRTRQTRLARARKCQFTPPEDLVVGPVVRILTPVIVRAMAASPRDRYRSARELRDEVERLIRGGAHMETRQFRRGQVVVKEGAEGAEAFIIEKGQCEVSKRRGGADQFVRDLGPGDVFGETAMLSGGIRTATVRATTRTVVRVVTRRDLENQLGLDSWLGSLVLALANRFREVDARLAEAGFGPRP